MDFSGTDARLERKYSPNKGAASLSEGISPKSARTIGFHQDQPGYAADAADPAEEIAKMEVTEPSRKRRVEVKCEDEGEFTPVHEGSEDVGLLKAPKLLKARSFRTKLSAPTAKFALATASSVMLSVALPSSEGELVELEIKTVMDSKLGASPKPRASTVKLDRAQLLELPRRRSSVLIELRDLKLSQSYSVTSLVVKDEHGARGAAEVSGLGALRPSWLLATDRQLSEVCDDLQLSRPSMDAGEMGTRGELLTRLLTSLPMTELKHLCLSLGEPTKGLVKSEQLVKCVVTKAGAGPRTAAEAMAGAASSRAECAREKSKAAEELVSKAPAEVTALDRLRAEAEKAEAEKAEKAELKAKAEQALRDAQKALRAAEAAASKAETAAVKTSRALEAEQRKHDKAKEQYAKAKVKSEEAEQEMEQSALIGEVAEKAMGSVVADEDAGGQAMTIPVDSDGQASMPPIGVIKLRNELRKWLHTLGLPVLQEMQLAMLNRKAGTKDEIVKAISSVSAAKELSKALKAAEPKLAANPEPMRRLFSQLSLEVGQRIEPFADVAKSIDWLASSLAPRPKEKVEAAGLRRAAVLDLLIVACSPNGQAALGQVTREAAELQDAMPNSSSEVAVSAARCAALLGKVPTKRFIFCGHGDATLNFGQRTLCFTSESGGLAAVEPQSVKQMLGGVAKRGVLELVFLNGCDTKALGDEVIKAGVPFVLCWESKVEDRAAKIFSVAFFKSLQQSLNQGAEPDYEAAFESAQASVTSSVTRPGVWASGLHGQVPKYELRAPELDAAGKDWSVSRADYRPTPVAAGVPRLLRQHHIPPSEPVKISRSRSY